MESCREDAFRRRQPKLAVVCAREMLAVIAVERPSLRVAGLARELTKFLGTLTNAILRDAHRRTLDADSRDKLEDAERVTAAAGPVPDNGGMA